MSLWNQLNDIPSKMELMIMAIAAWRVAVFLVRESGPWRIVRRVREWAGIDHDIEGRPLPYLGGMPGSLFTCVWCMSFWTAIMVYVVAVWADLIVIVMALWGLAALIETGMNLMAFHSYRDEPKPKPEPRWHTGEDVDEAMWAKPKEERERLSQDH